ncbi:type III polyketide synthase [Bacillaceae bacterium W0354]
MAIIHSVGTATPTHLIQQNEAKELLESLVQQSRLSKYLSVFDHAEIDERYYVAKKEWFLDQHSFKERNDLFVNEGIKLAQAAIEDCIKNSPLNYDQIDGIISVTSTGILTPSLEVHLMNKLPFRDDITRIPLFGLGCAGGGIGLSRAFDYLKAHPSSAILVVAVEVASVAFHKDNIQPRDVVGAALFSDGAGCVLLVGNEHPLAEKQLLRITGTSSKINKKSIDVMGWDIKDDGFHVIFAPSIPKLIPTFWKSHLEQFLTEFNLSMDEIKNILAHPGGRKVIEEIEKLLHEGQNLQFTKDVLRHYGNMSSPTVFFVLKKALAEKNQVFNTRYHLLTALGPGFSSEIILLEWK